MKTYPDEYIDSADFIKYAAELCREINGGEDNAQNNINGTAAD